MFKLFLILVLAPYLTYGYSRGAPKDACENMTPNHGAPSQGPFSDHIFTMGKPQFKLGEKIPISLSVPAQVALFKGFMIQVKD